MLVKKYCGLLFLIITIAVSVAGSNEHFLSAGAGSFGGAGSSTGAGSFGGAGSSTGAGSFGGAGSSTGSRLGFTLTDSEVEISIATRINRLFDTALKDNSFGSEHSDVGSDGSIVSLSIERYHQDLVTKRPANPGEAIEIFNMGKLDSDVEDQKHRYSIAPLRFRSHHSRNPNAVIPFLIKLKIEKARDVTTCNFLQNPRLQSLQWLRKCLYDFQIINCELSKLDLASFKNYENITILDVSKNEIKQLLQSSEIPLSTIQVLHLAGNKLEKLGSFFEGEFPWLEKLDLSGNKIDQLTDSCFKGLIRIEKLFLQNNLLTSENIHRKAFRSMSSALPTSNLTVDFSDNQLTSLPPMTDVRRGLKELVLTGNDCTSFEASDLKDLTELTWLRLSQTSTDEFLESVYNALPSDPTKPRKKCTIKIGFTTYNQEKRRRDGDDDDGDEAKKDGDALEAGYRTP